MLDPKYEIKKLGLQDFEEVNKHFVNTLQTKARTARDFVFNKTSTNSNAQNGFVISWNKMPLSHATTRTVGNL